MHSTVQEILDPLFDTTTKLPQGVPLYLAPATTAVKALLTTAQELLKKLIFTTNDRHRAWTDSDRAKMAKVAATTRALFCALEQVVYELKQYEKGITRIAETTELQRSQIRGVEKLVIELRKSTSPGGQHDENWNNTFRPGAVGQAGYKLRE